MDPGIESVEVDRRLSREAAAQLREIAHELRNPLNALTAIAEIFRDQRFGPLPGDKYLEYASLANGAAQRMLRLCDRLVVIHHGCVLATGTLEALRQETGRERLEDVFLALLKRAAA